jgi:nitrite reductase (NADH) small subunit
MSDEWVRVARAVDVKPGSVLVVRVRDAPVAVLRTPEGTLHALENTCPHRGGPVGEGPVTGDAITCPWHGWDFNLITGENARHPNARVRTFPVREEDGEVRVRTPPVMPQSPE